VIPCGIGDATVFSCGFTNGVARGKVEGSDGRD